MENSIYCPFTQTGICEKHKCAWWDAEFQHCVIHTLPHIAESLSEIEDELHILNENLRVIRNKI